jgi:ABC-type bacteriocin/lantibiotic exporter with double-glycine peptidase domain
VRRRRWLVPEVIQTSGMDCGPAALKALFAGYGLYLSYDRLREACQTDVDGTSIDTLEEMANMLGLAVEQHVTPADLVLLESSASLPAIVVTRLPGGAAHFVVLWRAHGPMVQVMDPAAGRIWMPRRAFLDSLYIHESLVETEAWQEWSRGPAFTASLEERMHRLGITEDLWEDRTHLDASLRMLQALANAGAVHRGKGARHVLRLCAENPAQIPAEYWAARAVPSDPPSDRVRVRGAVLAVASGPHAEAAVAIDSLPPSLAAVLREPPPHVWEPVWEAIRANGNGGRPLACAIALALAAAAAGAVFEALLFRSLFDLAQHLPLSGQRLAAFAMVLWFVAGLLVLEWSGTLGLARLGRHLELRLRARVLLKIPRLGDRHFQSRLISDMAFRAHTLHLLRQLPEFAGQFIRFAATLFVTAVALVWLHPEAAVPTMLAVVAAVGVPLLFQPALVERDLRVREISGALNRFSLDALLGSRAIQAHGAESTLRALHASQLAQWADAGLRQQALLVRAEAVQMTCVCAPIVWLVSSQVAHANSAAGLLLAIYWALAIPSTGRQLASVVWSVPALRNTMLRLLELLHAPEGDRSAGETGADLGVSGVKVDIDNVSVVAAGHVLLAGVNLHVTPGEHVAIVGQSGSGKSSLVGLLLGWHLPCDGRVAIDDVALGVDRLVRLRRETAWIDPQVHLFRGTLFDNLCYGNDSDNDNSSGNGNGDTAATRAAAVIADAGIAAVLRRMSDGLQTRLGEGGAHASAGEGQRVRIGRALARRGVRLAILDEPVRGLEREERRRMLRTLRSHFERVTLFAITHDISDTLDFDRVLVIERGRIIEQGVPRTLREQPNSRYRALLAEEHAVQRDFWSHPIWRRLRMIDGAILETSTTSARRETDSKTDGLGS